MHLFMDMETVKISRAKSAMTCGGLHRNRYDADEDATPWEITRLNKLKQ